MPNAIADVLKSSILILGALFPIVNPLGTAPIFLSLTRNSSKASHTVLAWKIALNGFVLLVVSMLIGTHILAFFGISLPVVQVGGGLIVIATGWTLLQQRDESPVPAAAVNDGRDRAVFRRAFYPLTLPLTVGPGSISVAITLGANEPHRGLNLLLLLPAVIGPALVAVTIYLSFRFAERLEALLGETAMSVILKLSSFILVCIGVQIVWNGVSALLKTVLV